MSNQISRARRSGQAKPGSLKRAGSVAHVHMEIVTSKGNRATVTGDPAMPETTMGAVAEMIDALSEAIVTGKMKCH